MTRQEPAKPFNKRAASALREARRNLASAQWKLAESNLLYASLLNPGDAVPYLLLAIVHRENKNLEAALQSYREARLRDPENVEGRIGACEVLQKLGRLPETVRELDSLNTAAMTSADKFRCAVLWDLTGRHSQALELADHVLASDPSHAGAALLRARSLSVLGAVEESAATYRRLISIKRKPAAAWFGLVDLKTQAVTDSDIEQMSALLRSCQEGSEERALLQHALGMALERTGRFEHAFLAFSQANAARSFSSPWNRTLEAAKLRRIEQAFKDIAPAEQASSASAGLRGREVVFVVGLPRSGTTLIEQILASHPDIEGCGELPDLPAVLTDHSRRSGLSIEEWASRASEVEWLAAGEEYLARTRHWRESKPKHTDKLPSNWAYGGFIARMLPGASVVHCLRDPLETCWSCYKQLFSSGSVGFTCNFHALADMSAMQLYFAGFWAQRFPHSYGLISYESLVQDPDHDIARLLAFCGLEYNQQCRDFHRSKRAVRTPSAAQVRQPLSKASEVTRAYGRLLDPLREAIAEAQLSWPCSRETLPLI